MSDTIRRRRRGLEAERQKLVTAHDQTCAALQHLLKQRWPELSNLLNSQVTTLLTQHADEIVRMIEKSAPYGELNRQDERLDAIDKELDDLERRAAKCLRFLRSVEHVALANNLRSIASAEICRRYDALVAAEGETLPRAPERRPSRRRRANRMRRRTSDGAGGGSVKPKAPAGRTIA